jgi:hypothetical protein
VCASIGSSVRILRSRIRGCGGSEARPTKGQVKIDITLEIGCESSGFWTLGKLGLGLLQM